MLMNRVLSAACCLLLGCVSGAPSPNPAPEAPSSPAAAAPGSSQAGPAEGDSLEPAPADAPVGTGPASASPTTTEDDAPKGPAPALPTGTTVLHIGDSMAAALQYELKKQLKEHGIKVISKTEEGTHLPLWGGKFSKVPSYVRTYKPDLVIVNLGGNDAVIEDPSDRVEPIRRLVEHLGGTPCVWVAPSLWAGENGVLGMIREHSKPCRYFDTNVLTPNLPREKKDKIHPSLEGRRIWTAALIDWLAREREESADRPWALKPADSTARRTQ